MNFLPRYGVGDLFSCRQMGLEQNKNKFGRNALHWGGWVCPLEKRCWSEKKLHIPESVALTGAHWAGNSGMASFLAVERLASLIRPGGGGTGRLLGGSSPKGVGLGGRPRCALKGMVSGRLLPALTVLCLWDFITWHSLTSSPVFGVRQKCLVQGDVNHGDISAWWAPASLRSSFLARGVPLNLHDFPLAAAV